MSENKTEPELISGTVEHITYRNSDSGFTVVELDCGSESITAVGIMPEIAKGESLEVTGHFDIHSTYGQQFKVDVCERTLPSGPSAILKYLSSGAVKGIGPATAKRIVHDFGEETFDVLENQPQRLAMIKGITKAKAEEICEEFSRRRSIREVMLHLGRLGVTADEALQVYKRYGQNSVDFIKADPFLLCKEGIDMPFERADEIATKMDLVPDSLERISAGVVYILKHNLNNGHTCLPREKLISVAAQMLDCNSYRADEACEELLALKIFNSVTINDKDFISLCDYSNAEQFIAAKIQLMLQYSDVHTHVDKIEVEAIEASLGIEYEELQQKAVMLSLEGGVLILTGGPGTGKTTTLKAIINLMENRGYTIALTAPTGRAAKRMTELTGYEAKTIHRLLEVEWSPEGGKHVFSRNERNPLECDVLIVDELSMVDALLFESLLKALRLGCRLILVGDSNQLPSVGAGNVLHDLLESGNVPSVCLQKVFRQAMQSLIVSNAHRIVNGEQPDLTCKDADFFMIEQFNPSTAAKLVSDLNIRRLPEAYGFSSLNDIQVLCPSKKMDLGTINLNSVLQANINPQIEGVPEVSFRGFTLRLNDKVMQIKNNYDIIWTRDNGEYGTGVFNGDIGIIENINVASQTLSVRFDDRLATYGGEETVQLELAYAITIHKSQGSEFECVILPLLDCPSMLRYRNLLYTAVTRAKKLLVIIGSKTVVYQMVDNDRKTLRYTALTHYLEEMRP
ncbi:MAG: ATP-dependent RecD-like DNA helicase [Oscillospiraceae bacterium]|nr:ATP-dependent RecD-like DNA helicase [Oscillospiraceae bacterium]